MTNNHRPGYASLTARYTTPVYLVGKLAFRSEHETFKEAQEAAEEILRLVGHLFDLRVVDSYGSEDSYAHGFYSCPCEQQL